MKMLLFLRFYQKPGGLSDIILPRTIQILPQKCSHHALLRDTRCMDTRRLGVSPWEQICCIRNR